MVLTGLPVHDRSALSSLARTGRTDVTHDCWNIPEHAPKALFASLSLAIGGAVVALFRIRHTTTYRYREPVYLGPHRLQLRPRESRDIRLREAAIEVSPNAGITWAFDVFGNAIATAFFTEPTDLLVVESKIALDHDAPAWPLFDVAVSATSYPFQYDPGECTDLGALLQPQHPDTDDRILNWARDFVRSDPTDTLSLLKDINAGIGAWVSYQAREDEGTQSPLESLDRRYGSCRDIAVLFIEAARHLGFGARIVSGYLANRAEDGPESSYAGTTHAWAEIYLPGAGWITFDPTNRTIGTFCLIPVAVARDIRQAVPVSGSFTGASDAFVSMNVDVEIQVTL